MADPLSPSQTVLAFEEHDFAINYQEIQLGPQIGQGQFSTVFLGRYFGDLVAIKKQTRNTKAIQNYLTRELAALNSLHHPNIIEFLG
jgi:serine/threonine protein kinase